MQLQFLHYTCREFESEQKKKIILTLNKGTDSLKCLNSKLNEKLSLLAPAPIKKRVRRTYLSCAPHKWQIINSGHKFIVGVTMHIVIHMHK